MANKRMTLTVDKDGFTIDTQQGMKVYINNERAMFAGDSTDDLDFPVDSIVELIHNLDLAYKLLIQSRTGDVHFNGQPENLVRNATDQKDKDNLTAGNSLSFELYKRDVSAIAKLVARRNKEDKTVYKILRRTITGCGVCPCGSVDYGMIADGITTRDGSSYICKQCNRWEWCE